MLGHFFTIVLGLHSLLAYLRLRLRSEIPHTLDNILEVLSVVAQTILQPTRMSEAYGAIAEPPPHRVTGFQASICDVDEVRTGVCAALDVYMGSLVNSIIAARKISFGMVS